MNKVILIGRLCNDPEVSYTTNNTAIAKYRVAVNRDRKKDGQQEADFLNCVAFGKNAEFVQKFLHKGTKIAVEGRIQTGSYDDKNGVKHYTTDIIVDRHEFCESKNSSDSYEHEERQAIRDETNGGFTAVEDNDLPF